MNWLQALMFLFHFTRLYKRETLDELDIFLASSLFIRFFFYTTDFMENCVLKLLVYQRLKGFFSFNHISLGSKVKERNYRYIENI